MCSNWMQSMFPRTCGEVFFNLVKCKKLCFRWPWLDYRLQFQLLKTRNGIRLRENVPKGKRSVPTKSQGRKAAARREVLGSQAILLKTTKVFERCFWQEVGVTGSFLGRWKECVTINQKVHWAPCLGHRGSTASSSKDKSCQLQQKRRKESCRKGVGAQGPPNPKGNPQLVLKKTSCALGFRRIPRAHEGGCSYIPPGASTARAQFWGRPGRCWEERTVRPTHLGGPGGRTDSFQINLRGPGRDGSPSTYSSGGPHAKGQRMNEPQIRPSLAG